ncbi:hypothetical protein C2845_PM04G01010 [Panicum miliaceum]|uniref:Uncharacterized protein n=1 Tax=Panicum miliaceum TaxID=4540 RepID=A0A3L6QQ64_PANMI|nr:hypothetical protein C2845_PM04G01010 [Panicum miliaceum]
MPMFIPDLFTEEEYMELGNTSNLLKEHKCICSRSEAFIPDATPQIEGLTAIMSKEGIEEAESSSSIIQIYHNFRIPLYTIGDAAPQEVFYDSKVGANVMSETLVDHIAPEEPLTFSRKHLKWIDGQIVKNTGILRVTPLKMARGARLKPASLAFAPFAAISRGVPLQELRSRVQYAQQSAQTDLMGFIPEEERIAQVAYLQMVLPQSLEYSPVSQDYNGDDEASDSDCGSKKECADIKALRKQLAVLELKLMDERVTESEIKLLAKVTGNEDLYRPQTQGFR